MAVGKDLSLWNPALDSDDPSLRSCPSVPRPVSIATGNVYLDQLDAQVPGVAAHGLAFVRSYNSLNTDVGQSGILGRGWSHSYEKRLSEPGTNILMLREGDGVVHYFQDSSHNGQPAPPDGIYEASVPYTNESRVVRQTDGSYVREFRGGGSEAYESVGQGGRLTRIVDRAGNTTHLPDRLKKKAEKADCKK